MPIYQFTATDQTGAPSQGTFEAPNEEQAFAQLAQYGLNVSQVVPMDNPAPAQPANSAPAAAAIQSVDNTPEKGKKADKAEKKQKTAKKKKKKSGLLAIEIGGGPTSEDI